MCVVVPPELVEEATSVMMTGCVECSGCDGGCGCGYGCGCGEEEDRGYGWGGDVRGGVGDDSAVNGGYGCGDGCHRFREEGGGILL